MKVYTCDRCGTPEVIVRVTLNRGGPREIGWCQRCLDEFRAWARISGASSHGGAGVEQPAGATPPPVPAAPPAPPRRKPKAKAVKARRK